MLDAAGEGAGRRPGSHVGGVEDGDVGTAQLAGGRAGGEEHLDAGVVDHESEPLDRVGRVEWQVRRAEAQRGKHADEHVHATRDGDADTIPATDTERGQRTGHRRGGGIELRIRQGAVAERERRRIRRSFDLDTEQLVDRDAAIVFDLGVVDGVEQGQLGGAQDREVGGWCGRLLETGRDQCPQLLGGAIEGDGIVRIGVGLDRQPAVADREPPRRVGIVGAVALRADVHEDRHRHVVAAGVWLPADGVAQQRASRTRARRALLGPGPGGHRTSTPGRSAGAAHRGGRAAPDEPSPHARRRPSQRT